MGLNFGIQGLFGRNQSEGEVAIAEGFGTRWRKPAELIKDFSASDDNITNAGWDTITSVKIDVEVGDIIQVSFTTNWQPTGGGQFTVFRITKDGVEKIAYLKEDAGGIGSDTFSMVWSENIAADGSPVYNVEAQSQGDGTEDLDDSSMSVLRI